MTCKCGHKHTQHYYDDNGREPCRYCKCHNFRSNKATNTKLTVALPRRRDEH
jgi:hypothetical protein